MKKRSISGTANNLFKFILVAGLYFLTAQLGYMTMLRPLNIPGLWAPSGLAQAAVLIWGWPAGLGILAGSFLSYLGVFKTPVAIGMALGGLLQAIFASWLLKRFIRPIPPETIRQTLLAMGLSALSAFLAPVVGSMGRYYAGTLAAENIATQIWIWWLSGMVGILIFMPGLIYLETRWRKVEVKEPLLWILTSLFIGTSLAVMLLYTNQEELDKYKQLQFTSIEVANIIQDTINNEVQNLNAIEAHYMTSATVSRENFEIFTRALLAKSPATSALEWLPRLSRLERKPYEQSQRDLGFANFTIFEKDKDGKNIPAGERDEYFPVTFLEPFESNKAAFGFDLGSNPERFSTIQRALVSGSPAASGPIHLVQESGSQNGILVLDPIFRKGAPTNTEAERRENLVGLIAGVYRVNTLIKASIKTLNIHDIELYIYDVEEKDRAQFLAFVPSTSGVQNIPLEKVPEPVALQNNVYYTIPLQVADRNWLMVTRPGIASSALANLWIDLIILLIGFGLSGGFLNYVDTRQKNEAALALSEAEFRSLSDNALTGVLRMNLSGEILYANLAAAQIFGLNYPTELEGTTLQSYFADKTQAVTFIESICTESNLRDVELEIRRITGKIRHILLSASNNNEVTNATLVDITERMLAEDEIRQLSSVVAHMADLVMITDHNGVINYVNPAFERLTGYSLVDVVGRTSRILKSGQQTEEFYRNLWNTILSGAVFEGEFINRKKSGELYYEIKTISPIRNSQGEITNFVATGKDVTERKQAEAALQESEARYKNIFNNNMAVMLLIDPASGSIVDANSSACNYYGWSRPELLRKKIFEINTLTQEEASIEMQAARAQKRNYFIFKHRLSSGELRDVEVYSGPLVVAGKQLLYSIIHDITDRRQAEEALRQRDAEFRMISEHTADMIFLLDVETQTFTYISPRVEKILGFTLEEMLHQPMERFLTPDTYQETVKNLPGRIEAFLQGTAPAYFTDEVNQLRKDGAIITTEVVTSYVEIEPGKIHVVGISRDISERKQAAMLQETVYRIAEDVQYSESLDDLYTQIHERISEVMPAKNFYIALYDEISNMLRFVYSQDEKGSYDPTPFPAGNGLTEYVLRTGRTLLCDDREEYILKAQEGYIPRGNPSATWLGAPLIAQGKTIGVMAVQHYQDPLAYGLREQRILEFVSSQVATAINRKQAEEVVRQVEKRNSALIQNAPDGIALVDEQGRFTFGSPSAFHLYGYTPEDVLGTKSIDLVHPDDRDLVNSSFNELVNDPKKVFTLQYRLLHKNGSFRWIESTLSNLLSEPGVKAVVNNFHDITERKNATELLQKSQASLEMAQIIARLGSWEYDLELGTSNWSNEMFRLFQRDQALGAPNLQEWMEMIHPEDRQPLVDAKQLSIDMKESVTYIFRVTWPHRKISYYETRLLASADTQGKLIHLSGTVMDVTERREMENEIRERVKELTCLFTISRLLENENLTEEVVCGQIVAHLRPAMQFPALAVPMVELNGQQYTTSSYTESLSHCISTPIAVQGETRGRLSVYYSQKTPFILPEEQEMIDNLALMLGMWLERKRSEKALRESNERFSQLAKNIQEVFWIYDNAHQELIYVSQAYEKVWGRPVHEAYANQSAYLSYILPEDLPILLAAEERQARAESTDNEYRILRPDGSLRWVWDRGFPIFDDNGNFVRTAGVATDITELKNAQFALLELNRDLEKRVEEGTFEVRQSEATYRALFENSNDGIFIISPEGVELRANQQGLDLLGYTQEEWHEITFQQVTAPDERQDAENRFAAVLRGERVPIYERTLIRKDGTPIKTELNLSAIRDAEGRIILVQSVVRDISERKKAEEAIRATSELFSKFMMYSPIYAFVKDVTPTRSLVLFSSENFVDMIGVPGTQMVGKTMHDLFPKEFAEKITADDWSVVSSGEMISLEEELNGRYYTSIKFPIIQGERTLLAGYTIDITERKNSEESLRISEDRYRKAISAADAVPYSLDYATNCYTFMGEGIEQLTGYNRQEMTPDLFNSIVLEALFNGELAGKSTTEVVHLVRSGESTPDGVLQCDFRILTKNGEERWVSDASVQVSTETGQSTGAIGFLLDITDRKRAEESLRESRDKLSAANIALEKASRMKDEFLASMSHELRTPLTGILGLSEALQLQMHGGLNEKQLKAVGNIEKSGRHLLDLINDILDLSKIEAGKLDMQIEACSVAEICQSSLSLVKGMAQQKRQNINFGINMASITIQADARRLKQMLVNLLSNAIKFTPENGQIGLNVEAYSEEKHIRFTVWDKGIGIRPEGLDKLFQPFLQLDSSLARQYSGTGLGLSLVQRMAELQGGSVEVQSTFGEGSRFTIILPWIATEIKQRKVESQDDLTTLNRIFVGEHDLDGEQITRHLIEIGIHKVVHLPTIQEALEKAASLQPGAILLDLNMPDGSGVELLSQLTTDVRTRHIPVIIISAVQRHAEAIKLGAADCLVRPFRPDDLRTVFLKSAPTTIHPGKTVLVIEKRSSLPLVLVTDDNELVLETISEFLEASGFRVITARNGFELLELAPKLKPDLILVDIQMPGMDGMEAMRQLRSNKDAMIASTPIIAITALAMTGDRERCLEAGANEYMSKPVVMKDLANKIIRVLETRQKES